MIPLLAALVLLAAPVVALRARRRVRRSGESWRSASAVAALNASAVVALVAVLVVTLRPIGLGGTATANWVPFATIIDQVTSQVDASVAFRNLGGNVLLFVPVGFLWTWVAVRSGLSWRTALAASAALSLLVELVQFVAPLGRAVDVDDVLLNVLGALLGSLVLWGASSILGTAGVTRRRRRSE